MRYFIYGIGSIAIAFMKLLRWSLALISIVSQENICFLPDTLQWLPDGANFPLKCILKSAKGNKNST